jgi:hypothetical protein
MADRDHRPAVTIGHVIGGFFGVAFVIANSGPLPESWRDVMIAAAMALSLLSVVRFRRGVREGSLSRAPQDERFDRSFWLIVVVEVVALFGGLAVLNRWQPSAAVAWVALVVGLHFFLLARLWRSSFTEIALVATALTVLGVVGLVVAFTADSADAVALISGVGSGVVLLGNSVSGLVRRR